METDKENNPEFVEHAQSNTSDQQAGNCTCGQPNPQGTPGQQAGNCTCGQPNPQGTPGQQAGNCTCGQPNPQGTPGQQAGNCTCGQPNPQGTPDQQAGNCTCGQPNPQDRYHPPYTYGGQFNGTMVNKPQFPFGQVGRPFGYFDGCFIPGSATPIRSRTATAVLCLLLGPFGIHKFYTGQWGWGLVSLFLLITLGWTGWIWGILYAVSLAESILLFTMSNEEFQNKYHMRAQ